MNLLLVAILIIIAIFSSKITNLFGVPKLILFVLIGLIVGSDVLGLVYFDDALLTKTIADILLIFIIFDGGFLTSREAMKQVAGPALSLATLGVVVTALILGYAIHVLFSLELLQAMMIGAIISSTDAAAVFMINQQYPIQKRVATTINVESAVNDPMAIVLTTVIIQLITIGSTSPTDFLLQILWQFVGGIAIGVGVAKLSAWLFDRLGSANRGNYNVLIIGFILLAYGLAVLINSNGIIAAFFMGFFLGNSSFTAKQGVTNFLASISTLSNVTLFLMLGLLAFPSQFLGIWKEGLVVGLVLMFIARPIAVWIFTLPFKYSLKEKVLISWGGIKGAVPIVLATYPAAANLDNDGLVFNIIFFAVLLTCIVQGMTFGPLAEKLKLTEARKPISPYTVELHTTRKSDIDMYEVHIEPDAYCVDRRISELQLGREVLISSIIRDERLILPKGGDIIMPNDILFILAHADEIEAVNEALTSGGCVATA